MELDSVRGLKIELTQQLGSSAVAVPAGLESKDAAEEPLSTYEIAPLALGIAPSPRGDYLLAVRVQDEALLGGWELRRIEEEARGEIDVRFIGPAVPAASRTSNWPRESCRPLAIGASVGSDEARTTGTIGCFVRPDNGGPVALLSNNHILADEDRLAFGSPIVQPGWDDGGRSETDAVATLASAIPLVRSGVNELDCAIATLNEGVAFEPAEVRGIGSLGAVAGATLNQEVHKVGRTTTKTRGTVAAIETGPVRFGYSIGELAFDGLVEVHGAGAGPFARRGDSGSLVLTSGANEAIGLVFGITGRGGANGAGVTYVNPLQDVLDRLGVSLVLSDR